MKKKVLSLVMVIITLLSFIPVVNAGASISDLKNKFPDGAYWNHPSGSNNPDGYSYTPCTHHDNCDYYGNCACNSFLNAIQCHGFALKLGYDYYGTSPRNWSQIYTTNSLKAGDIVRYQNGSWQHSIWVTNVNGDTVTYADCNSDGHCKIRWDKTISKSTLSSNLIYVLSAPYAADNDPTPPGNTWISVNKTTFNVGETITFSFGYKYGTSVSLGIDKDGTRYSNPEVTGLSSYSCSFSEAGTYSVYVSGWSQNGYEDSEKVTFTVTNGVSNSDTWIGADKTSCYIGDSVNFTFRYKYTTSVSLGIDKDGVRYANPEVTGTTSYNFNFTEIGIYTIYVSGWSPSGYEDSERVTITVSNRPTSIHNNVNISSETYSVHSQISNLSQSAIYTVAMYSADRELIDVKTQTLDSSATSTSANLEKSDKASYIKVYLWDNLNSMKPLVECEKITL